MIYLLDSLDMDIFEIGEDEYFNFTLWLTSEERVKRWIENERSRSIFSKQEIKELFGVGSIQIGQVTKIRLTKYDKVILWTESKKYYVMEVVGFTK